jgi:hypothetical protein
VHRGFGNARARPDRGGHAGVEHGEQDVGRGVLGTVRGGDRGGRSTSWRSLGAWEVASFADQVWVPTGGRKEGGRIVASRASYWALEAVLGGVYLVRERMVGRQGSRKGRNRGGQQQIFERGGRHRPSSPSSPSTCCQECCSTKHVYSERVRVLERSVRWL